MTNVSRRAFLKAAAAAAAPTIIPSSVRGAHAPSNRINVATVGLGPMGKGHMGALLGNPGAQVVAVCDIFKLKIDTGCEQVNARYEEAKKAGSYTGCKGFLDFRELLALPGLDAVTIATPDHWHALVAVAACAAGKDVYCEKPLGLTHFESRAIANAARRFGTVFQVGSQQRSDDKFRHACELARNGLIGDIKEVFIAVGGSPKPYCTLPAETLPEGLDWNMWLGPAPVRPYNKVLCPDVWQHGFSGWRGYAEFGGGGQADFGAHHYDIAQWGLGMDESGPVEVIPPTKSQPLTYRYASGVTMYRSGKEPGAAITFVGTQGWVGVNRGSFLKSSRVALETYAFRPSDIRLYKSANHMQNWLDCVKTRGPTICTAETGHRTATICQIGTIAETLGRPLTWDPAAERFGDEAACRMLRREMRAPWAI
jgi:predicted dehydrogenase